MDSKKITLSKLFDLQQACLEKHISTCAEGYSFVKDCLEVVLNARLEEQISLTTRDEMKLGIFRIFLHDALSSLLNSFKLLLYGCPTDSLALLRVSLEALMMTSYIMQQAENNKFEEVKAKINNQKYLRDLLKEAKAKIKNCKEIKRDYGKLSNLGSHFSTKRLQFSSFEINGTTYPRIGMSIDPSTVDKFIGFHIKASLYLVRINTTFFKLRQGEIASDYFEKVNDLEIRYEALANKLKEGKR